MLLSVPAFYCGIDWSEGLNDVAVVTRAGLLVAQARIPETPAGIAELFALLDGLRKGHSHGRRMVPVGIETDRGLLVEGLVGRRQPVYPIAPTAVTAYRRRLSPVRKKSDRTDAEIIALVLRDDWARLRPRHMPSAEVISLATLVAAHRRARHTRIRLQGQLRSLLRLAHPAAVTAWGHLDGGLARPEARAVLATAPTAAASRRLTHYRLSKVLASAGRRRLVDAEAYRLLELFAQPVITRRADVEQAACAEVRATLTLFDAACSVEAELQQSVEMAAADHPHAPVYLSFPGCGLLTAARLLAGIGDDVSRFADARGLRAYAGVAPVTFESGSNRIVLQRRVCNRALKTACHQWAFASLTRSAGSRLLYDGRRTAGDSHASALRRVAARLLGGLHHCLRHEALFDEGVLFGSNP